MKRNYTKFFQEYYNKKIILITGPRQSGKTTIAKMFSGSNDYLNFDDEEDRDVLAEKSWDRSKDIIIFDELHKKPNWKSWLKGVYDKEKIPPSLVVTGSARLDMYKKVGDSLAGRFLQYRLHPFDIRELHTIDKKIDLETTIEKLLSIGGFPEPFLDGSQKFYNLWKKSHLDIILRQDLISQEDVRDIKSIELLIDLLKKRVGSPLSYSSLANDLHVSDKTVKRWIEILENMYVIFKITPFSKNIARSNLKKPKLYFYDNARVMGNEGSRLENLVACSLLKECQFRQDCLGENWSLHYLSKRGGIELDFLLTRDDIPKVIVEVKQSDDTPSKNFSTFAHEIHEVKKVQIVKNLKREKTFPSGVEIRSLGKWLCTW